MKKTVIATLIISGFLLSPHHLAAENNDAVRQEETNSTISNNEHASSLEVGQVFSDSQGVHYKILSLDNDHGYVQVGNGETPIPNLDSYIQLPETLEYQGISFTVTEIGSFAFTKYQDEGGAIAEGGSNVEIIELPRSLTTIQPKAFYSSLDLRLVHFASDSQLTTIGKDAFAFSGLSKITIPDSVVEIGANAFVFNEFLTEFNLNESSSLQTIGEGALRTTRQLKHMYIPTSLTSIGERPFSGSIGLQSITVSPDNPNYASIDGVLFDKSLQTLVTYPADHDGHDYLVPSTVTNIDDHAFEYDVNLKTLTLPDSVQQVGDLAFKNMRKLETLHLNEGLTSVGRLAFYGINQLKELTLPNTLTDYGRNPLYELDGLENLTIGTGTTHLPANFLGGPFTQIKTITILGEEVTFDSDMFSFFSTTDWQNLTFFVANETIREHLLDTLAIEKEQVNILEITPEEPVVPSEPETPEDSENTEQSEPQQPEEPTETETDVEKPTTPTEPNEEEDTESPDNTEELSTEDEEATEDTHINTGSGTPSEKPKEEQTTLPSTNEANKQSSEQLTQHNQLNMKAETSIPQTLNKKGTQASRMLPQTNEANRNTLFVLLGSTLLTTVAAIFYKKH